MTRAVIAADPPSVASTTAAAPAPQRASNGVPRPGTRASDTTTSATRALPAATASAAPRSASIPEWGEPLVSAPPAWCESPMAVASTAWLGPSANGGRVVPHQSPSTPVGSMAAASSASRAAAAASVRVSSSGAQTAATPLPPRRPHAAATSEAASRRLGAPAPTATIRTGLTTNLTLASHLLALSSVGGSGRRRRARDERPPENYGSKIPMPSGKASCESIVCGGWALPWTKRILRTCPVLSPGPTPSAEITIPMSA